MLVKVIRLASASFPFSRSVSRTYDVSSAFDNAHAPAIAERVSFFPQPE
jgi:hypothetical protein